ncbi:MAG TPA: iron-sulfur cluster insertion protein ErpA [Hyphomonadaceae bacterium]|nr:iron-sulfur cluster insertion protein ErpA [Hyphomonadaceae bacterium]
MSTSPLLSAAAQIGLSPAAAARIKIILAEDGDGAKALRVAVLGGGCSGFRYDFGFAAAPDAGDIVLERDGALVFVDPVSADFLQGAELDYVEQLIGSSFQIKNPNAKSGCGCGVSFSV